MIEVACAADERYAPHCATMLQSLVARHAGTPLRVHLLHSADLYPSTRERLRAFLEARGVTLNLLPVTAELIEGFPDRRFHIACWYRVLLPTLLPQVERVLYLDSDLLVLDDLRPLWQTDLRGNSFAAVVNMLYPFQSGHARTLGLAGPRDYLNSGVMLMDLARMRASGLTERLRQFALAHPDNPWPEQDALSTVCAGQWLALPPRWNAQSALWDLKPAQLPFTAGEIAEARERTAIVHFIGPLKPWHFLCRHPLRQLYVEHRRQTPWPDLPLEGVTFGNRLLRPFSLHTQLRLRRLAGPLMPLYHHLAWRWRQARLRGPGLMRAFARHYPEAVFVQIGSNDGVKHDPLRATFARSRWRGVMVEPVPYVFARLAARYGRDPRVRLEQAAVGTTSGSVPFYHVAEAAPGETLPDWYDGLGSFRKEVVLDHRDRIAGLEQRLVATEVRCVTFEELCQRNGIERLDLLHLDTEGYDYDILKSVDFARWRPLLVLYEHKHLGPARAECRQRLETLGYRAFEEAADTWCVDTRTRDDRHRQLLAAWDRHTTGAAP